jgi:hypothetical protein
MIKLTSRRFFSLLLLLLSSFAIVFSAFSSSIFLRGQHCVILFEIISLVISIKEFFNPSQNKTNEDYFLSNICALVFLFPSILQATIGCIYCNDFIQYYIFIGFGMPFHVKFNLIVISLLASLLYLFFTINLAKNFETIIFHNCKWNPCRKALFVLTPVL